MAVKLKDLPLTELYTKKITASVEAAIQSKEDFSKISPDYCSKVCRLKCKASKGVNLIHPVADAPLDILIVQDHSAPKGKYDKTNNAQELIQREILDFICQKAGFDGLNYRITNLLKCPPSEEDFPDRKPPSIVTLNKCKPYVLSEIERLKPKLIISLSTAVTKALGYSKLSNTSNRGEIHGNVLITLHPRVLAMIRQNATGAMWGNDYFEVIRRDFEKASKLVRGQLRLLNLHEAISEQRKNIRICRSLDDVREVTETISSLSDAHMVSVDTETTGLDPLDEKAKLLCIQFGWKNDKDIYVAAVIPLWHRENTAYAPRDAWKILAPILISPNIPKILHNGKFDVLYIYHTTGLRMQGIEFDTMLALHALDSGKQGCFSLKAAIWDYAIDTGLGGYEGLLPSLTKSKVSEEEKKSEEEKESEEVENE